jgi:hypothetical protein
MIPPSSSPHDIYLSLRAAVSRGDTHDPKIKEQRAGLVARATDWHSNGEITAETRDEIIWSAVEGGIQHWRPVLYVIPKVAVSGRLERVPAPKRAGLGDEFIIADLKRTEFDAIEIRL